jgi:hypothetical protein
LRQRTSDDNYHAASDHRDYRIIGQNHAAGGIGYRGLMQGEAFREEDFDRRILGTFTKSAHAKIIAALI